MLDCEFAYVSVSYHTVRASSQILRFLTGRAESTIVARYALWFRLSPKLSLYESLRLWWPRLTSNARPFAHSPIAPTLQASNASHLFPMTGRKR